MSYDIVIITHPPFFKYIPDLLKSINLNNAKSIKLFSSLTNNSDANEIRSLIKKNYNKNNLDLIISSKPSTIAKSRTQMAKKCTGDWIVFIDSDIILNKEYFPTLEKIIPSLKKNTVAIAGGIDINLSTKYGFWEGYADMRVYYNGVLDSKYNFDPFSITKSLRSNLKKFSGCETKYLQGYNHVIKRSFLKKISYYDVKFWSAEDREMACNIRSKGFSIQLFPELAALHNYNFSLRDIIRRKRIHGYWYTRLRKKYPDENLVPQLTTKLVFRFVKTLIFGHRKFRSFS